MAKVIFTYYPLAVYYNHACCLLSAICKERGIESYVIPMGEWFGSSLETIRPDYVCMSFVTVHDYERSKPYIEMVKRSEIPILAGGVYPRMGEHLPEFDFVCRGEGELLPDFILNGDTTIFDTEYFCEDITKLPLPDYSNVMGNEFKRNSEYLRGKKIIPYISSRGCPYHCNFCVTKLQSKKIRIKNAVREDLEFLHNKFNPDLFHIMDELPPYYKKEWRDQVEGNEYPFFSFIRADIKEDELNFLIKNGLTICSFGVEVGDEEYRNKVLNKGVTDKDIWRTVEILDAYRIPHIAFFMTGMEPDEVKWKTFDMAENIGGEAIIYQYEGLVKESLWDGQ